MAERRDWIAQCLCPKRHAILAASREEETREAAELTVLAPLREQIAELLAIGAINPWCGLCQSPSDAWTYELGRTRFPSMEEAMPELRRVEAQQAALRAAAGEP